VAEPGSGQAAAGGVPEQVCKGRKTRLCEKISTDETTEGTEQFSVVSTKIT
jgi:hypothetical protein